MKSLIAVLLALSLFTSCVNNNLEPTVDLSENSLRPAIQFQTANHSEAFISYWPKDNPFQKQHSRKSTGKDHRVILLNLKPATTYDYVIHTSNPERTTNALSFTTAPLPAFVTQSAKVKIDTSVFNGYVLIRRLAPFGVDVIIDRAGDVVWYHKYDTVVRRPFNWTSRGTILSVYDSSRVVEYDLEGNKLLDIDASLFGKGNTLHHDAVLNAEGNVVALSHDSTTMDLRRFGYARDQNIRGDGIIVFDRQGKLLWKWNILDVYDPNHYPERKPDLYHSLGHSNSLAIDNDGNYIISFRDFSEIWKINAIDGSVIWKLGEEGDIATGKDHAFLRQHAAYITDEGELMLFDNGDRKTRPLSRVLSFKIDEHARQAKVRTNVVLPAELSADKMCSAVRITPGKFLICTSKRNGIISVVNDNAEVLWRVDLNSPSFRAYYLSNPFAQNTE